MMHQLICDINIAAGKIVSAGRLLRDWNPDEFPNASEVFSDLGVGIIQAGQEIATAMNLLDAENIRAARVAREADLEARKPEIVESLESTAKALQEKADSLKQPS